MFTVCCVQSSKVHPLILSILTNRQYWGIAKGVYGVAPSQKLASQQIDICQQIEKFLGTTELLSEQQNIYSLVIYCALLFEMLHSYNSFNLNVMVSISMETKKELYMFGDDTV